jgi:hypothetical protein
MLEQLRELGFEIEFHSHAQAILLHDFPDALAELEIALGNFSIPIEELIASGGGEAKGTQRLRRALTDLGWIKGTITIEKRVNTIARESVSHAIDHLRTFKGNQTIALEIEWNNKDPFFDRDLENFKRLHAEGAISVGVIVTRGTSLQDAMRSLIVRFCDKRNICSFDDLENFGIVPTRRQRNAVLARVHDHSDFQAFRKAWTEHFVSDKFGAATTHWRKLQDRVLRGVGNPCPLLLIGIPASVISLEASEALVHEILAAELEG